MVERKCIACGLLSRHWTENDGRGYVKESAWYCCAECADGTRTRRSLREYQHASGL